MKKFLNLFSITLFILLLQFIFIKNSYAASLDTINTETNKVIVNPGEDVILTINFGENLGAYTFNISYDNNLFEYVTVDGGTANDTSDKVVVTFYDTTGGSNPRNYMNITFKAKEGITTSNPTEFLITAEGLSNADVSDVFDDITTPIVKNVTVEPNYIDYTIKLTPIDNIIEDEEKNMIISYSSAMGRYYEHARLIAEVVTPEGAYVKLLGTAQDGIEYDIVQSGWGDAQGYPIGGQDVVSELDVRGLFNKSGNYTVILKLIDRDNSDSVISQNTFQILVSDSTENIQTENNEETNITENTDELTTLEENAVLIEENVGAVSQSNIAVTEGTSETNTTSKTSNQELSLEVSKQVSSEVTNETKVPTKLPKTGVNFYIHAIVLVIALISIFIYINRKK